MVLWLGGPPGAGKTTVARLLTRRYGLRWYSADAHTWRHRDRAIAEGNPAAVRWERLSPRERWSRPVDELLEMSLHHDRARMVLDDVRALPPAPLVLAEGTTVTPSVAGTGDHSLWLLPEPGVQGLRLAGRALGPGPAALYRRLAEVIAAQVADAGARFLAVGPDADPTDTVAAVEEFFADALASAPRARTPDGRRALLRYANRAVVRQYTGYFARPWARGGAEEAVASFSCECARTSCTAQVELTVAGFPPSGDDAAVASPVLAPGHRPAGG